MKTKTKSKSGIKIGIATTATLVIVIAALAAFSSPVSAQGDPGAGCPATTQFNGTINGNIFFEQQGWSEFSPVNKTFDVPTENIKLARVYTGIWQGSPGKGGYFNITIDNATTLPPFTTDTYKACDPCPNATDCLDDGHQLARCDALNASTNSPWNDALDTVNMRDYIVGCGVQFISFNATPYITQGSNTITVNTEACGDCTRGGWDGRVYLIALLVVYENDLLPEITYWINEGAPYLENGSDCDGPSDHLYASQYFNGSHLSNPVRVKMWSLGWPHVINATTTLNTYDIGTPDITESYAGGYYEVMLRWNDIATTSLDSTSNFLVYNDPDPLYERGFVETLIVHGPIGPDLEVTNIQFPTMMRPGTSYDITATVDNYGDEAAEAFNVSLDIGGSFDQKKTVSGGLAAGCSVDVPFTVSRPKGCYNFSVTADCDGNVSEGNEYNNEKEEWYQVGYVIVVKSNSDFEELNPVSGNYPLPAGCFENTSGTYYIQNMNGDYAIKNCAGDGIEIRNTNVPFVIRNCTIYDCGEQTKDGCGVLFHSVTNGKMGTDNEVRSCSLKGIKMQNCHDVTIDGNYVHDNEDYGIDVYMARMPTLDSHDITITNNNITRNAYGIELMGYECTVRDNVILNSTAYGGGEEGWGIYVAGNSSEISNNTVKYSDGYAIRVDYDRPGIPAELNCIFGNNFIDNNQLTSHTAQAYDSGNANTWESRVKLGYYNSTDEPFDNYIGNNWSDYKVRYPTAGERDGSEIWDTAYVMDSGKGNRDNASLMKPWTEYTRIKYGDVNCDGFIDSADGDAIYYVDGGVISASDLKSEWAADVNCDGFIDSADGDAIYYVDGGVISASDLNCCTGC